MRFDMGSAIQNALIHVSLTLRDLDTHERFEQVLRFGSTDVQSAMDLHQPDRLVLNYTRLMMGFMLFQPRPKNMLMIGLGGGSLPKFCHRHFPDTDLTVVEIDPLVIAMRDHFEVPGDQCNFRVVEADGADFVNTMDEASFDVIMVDGFGAEGMAPSLGTQSFYDQCACLLTEGGVMVCNLHEVDLSFGAYLDRMGLSFHDNVLRVAARECGNSVVFARKNTPIAADVPRHLRCPLGLPAHAWSGIKADIHDVWRRARNVQAYL